MDLAKSSLKIFFARTTKSISGFIAVVIFSRYLGASPLGVYYPFIALLGILVLPADLGVSHAMKKRISEGDDRNAFFGAGLSIKLPAIILVSVIIFVLRNHVNQYIGGSVAILLIIALWLRIGSGTLLAVLEGELRVGETAIIRVLQPLGWLAFGSLFIALGFDVTGIIYGHMIGNAAMVVTAAWKVSVYPTVPARKHLISIFDFGKFSFINSIGGLIYSWMDVLILSAFVSLEITLSRSDIGAYENAWRVSLLVTMVSRSISQVVFPQISQWDAQGNHDQIERLLPKAVIPGLLLVPPSLAGTIVLGEEILLYLFGPEFAVASTAMIVLVGFRVFQAISEIYARMIDALDRPDLSMITTLVAIFLNIILNVVLIYYIGILGAAIATSVAFAVQACLGVYFMSEFVTIRLPTQILLWSVLSSIIMGILLIIFTRMYPISSVADLIIVVGIGAGIYALVLIMSRSVREFTHGAISMIRQ